MMMKTLCLFSLLVSCFCSWALNAQQEIVKNMYKKQQVFANQTSLATLRKMQINRFNHTA